MCTTPNSPEKVIIMGFIDDLAIVEDAKDPEDVERKHKSPT